MNCSAKVVRVTMNARGQWTAWRSVILSGSVTARVRKRLTQCVLVPLHDACGFADTLASIPFLIEPLDLDIARVRRRPTRRTNRRSAPTPAAQTTRPSSECLDHFYHP